MREIDDDFEPSESLKVDLIEEINSQCLDIYLTVKKVAELAASIKEKMNFRQTDRHKIPSFLRLTEVITYLQSVEESAKKLVDSDDKFYGTPFNESHDKKLKSDEFVDDLFLRDLANYGNGRK